MHTLHQEPSPRLATCMFLPWPHLNTHSPSFSELRRLPLLLAQQSSFFNHENTYPGVAHMPGGGGWGEGTVLNKMLVGFPFLVPSPPLSHLLSPFAFAPGLPYFLNQKSENQNTFLASNTSWFPPRVSFR